MFINVRITKDLGHIPMYYEDGKYTLYTFAPKGGLVFVRAFDTRKAAQAYRETMKK